MAAFFVVLAMHGAVLYSLWKYRVLPPPSEAATVFVDLLKASPRPKPARPSLPKPRRIEWDRPRVPDPPPSRQLVTEAPVVPSNEPVAPPTASAPVRIEAPVEPASPPSKRADPAVLSGDLAVSCPERTPPPYPLVSRRLGEEGKAVLRVELDEDGQVESATVKTSSGYARLDEAALYAVKHWRCKPTQRDGVMVRAVALQPFNFVLEGR